MNNRNLLSLLTATSLVTLPAALPAQTSVTSTSKAAQNYVEIEDDAVIVPAFNLSVDDIDDFDVFGATGEKVGEIDEVLADDSGAPMAVVIDLEDDLKMDEDDVILTLDQLDLVDGSFRIGLTHEDLSTLPKWDD